MKWPWSRRPAPRASDEAYEALAHGREQLVNANRIHTEVGVVHSAATATLSRNHFGAAITAAMRGEGKE